MCLLETDPPVSLLVSLRNPPKKGMPAIAVSFVRFGGKKNGWPWLTNRRQKGTYEANSQRKSGSPKMVQTRRNKSTVPNKYLRRFSFPFFVFLDIPSVSVAAWFRF